MAIGWTEFWIFIGCFLAIRVSRDNWPVRAIPVIIFRPNQRSADKKVFFIFRLEKIRFGRS